MKELLEKINVREIVLLLAVGVACWFGGSNQGLRQLDSRVITAQSQTIKTQSQAIKKHVQLANFAIKKDSTGVVARAAKQLGLMDK